MISNEEETQISTDVSGGGKSSEVFVRHDTKQLNQGISSLQKDEEEKEER